jgi:thiamine biosynthesis protein ThiS
MTIQINGESRMVAPELTIAGLLNELNIQNEQVAVEVNLQIVERQQFSRHLLAEGDRIEIMSFIGGG